MTPELYAAALSWTTTALREELPDMRTAWLTERAETLLAIAEEHHIAAEQLIEWIHYRNPDKQWSTAEWLRWCLKYRDTLAAIHHLAQQHHDEWRKLCPGCYSHAAHRINDRWLCPECGEVQ